MSQRLESPVSKPSSTHKPADTPAERGARARGVMIVDDHEVVRWGLRSLIQAHSESANESMRIFEAPTLTNALALFEAHQTEIDLVFLDLGLADTIGLSGLAAFREQHPSASVAVISGDSNFKTIEGALAIGARAYLKKTGDLAEILRYLQENGLIGTHGSTDGIPHGLNELHKKKQELTERQMKILEGVLEGKSNREIGELACLAKGTVKNHVTTLLLHFGLKTRAQLISSLR